MRLVTCSREEMAFFEFGETNTLYSITYGLGAFIVGAPHHTAPGSRNIWLHPASRYFSERKGRRPGDENTGALAALLASLLNGRALIASHPNHDPNKEEDPSPLHADDGTSYLACLFGRNPQQVLIEIHGHGGTKSHFDIEVSCGSPLTPWPQCGRSLADAWRSRDPTLNVGGEYGEIYYKASKTLSLRRARRLGVIPYHIELHSRYRLDNAGGEGAYVTAEGGRAMESLAKTLKALHPGLTAG